MQKIVLLQVIKREVPNVVWEGVFIVWKPAATKVILIFSED